MRDTFHDVKVASQGAGAARAARGARPVAPVTRVKSVQSGADIDESSVGLCSWL